MKNSITAAIVGFIFALGLGISGMTQPQKVVAFLDLFGAWDPSLMFVMVGAILVHGITYKMIRRRPHPMFSPQWHVPEKTNLTPSLAIGALIFGIGWGIGGFCPGPALTSVGAGQTRPMIFVISMFLGMFLFKVLDKKFRFNR